MALKRLPDGICDFLNYLEEVQEQYVLIHEEIERMDYLTEDYLHKMEQPLSSSERNKVATSLRRCRLLRRKLKNEAAIIQPLIDFTASGRGANLLEQLETLMEKTQTVAQNLTPGNYQPQVMSQDEFNKL